MSDPRCTFKLKGGIKKGGEEDRTIRTVFKIMSQNYTAKHKIVFNIVTKSSKTYLNV